MSPLLTDSGGGHRQKSVDFIGNITASIGALQHDHTHHVLRRIHA